MVHRKVLGTTFVMSCAIVMGCSDSHPKDEASPGLGAGNDTATSGSAGSGAGGGNLPTPNGGPLPTFPGAGTSDAAAPLPNGMLCDSVPGQDLPIPGGGQATCFVDKNDPNNTNVAATLEQVLECVEETDTVHIRLTFHPWFVDNTYGAGSIGWPRKRGHSFDPDLVKSDHAEIILTNGSGATVLQFKLDYVSADSSTPSGFGSLGVLGGDGSVAVGDAAAVVRWMTSIDRNLNERGYASHVTDSPATDEDYTPNPATPEWDYRVVYEAWIDLGIFGDAGFGGAHIEYVHASPAKSPSDTIEVVPGDCPPPRCGDQPDEFCSDAGIPDSGTPPNPCFDGNPDTFCDDGGVPPTDPEFCEQYPDDPSCQSPM